tara:strand:+ start:168 stop:1340 length:1173 start_codon:yes stop_codon:yes gene_type:complete
MVNYKKEISRLKEWKNIVVAYSLEIARIAKKNKTIFYSISSVSSDTKINPYTTPIRLSGDKLIAGCIVGSQIEALIVANYVESSIDYLLLDVEKKIPIQNIPHEKIFLAFNLNKALYVENSKTASGVEFGNISSAVRKTFPSHKIINYKPNDLTVESIWFFLSHKFKNFANLKIAIVGSGNIGFKLALKLVESGSYVNLNRRDKVLGLQLASTINSIKPKNTLANAEYYEDPVRACALCDVVIGTGKTDSLIINESMVSVIVKGGILIDCGKGNITESAIDYAYKLGLNIYRSDVTSGIISFVDQAIMIKKIINNKTGRKLLGDKIFIISGGIYGKLGDIIVDNFDAPKIIYGMADGRGQLIEKLTNSQFKQIKYVSNYFKINQYFSEIL